jgi:hypothetical protein
VDPSYDDVEANESSRRRSDLERRAFARPSSDEDRRGALEAQQLLKAIDDAAATSTGDRIEDPTIGEEPAQEEEIASAPAAVDRAPSKRRRRAGLIAVGAVGLTVGIAFDQYVLPGLISAVSPPSSSILVLPAGASNTASTRRWFLHAQTQADQVPTSTLGTKTSEFSEASTRLVDVEQDGGRVWVAISKNPADSYCLIYETSGTTTAKKRISTVECTAFTRFTRDGVSIVVAGTAIHWDSQDISVTEG